MPPSLIVLIQPAKHSYASAQAQRGALAALRDSECALALCEAEANSPHLLLDLRQYLAVHQPRGAILMSPLSAVPGLVELCLELGTQPVRLTPGGLPGPVATLCSNDRQAAADATQYLIALGHQRIGFIAGPESCPSVIACELGFVDALAAHELDRGAELVAASDGTVASGEAAARLLLEVSPRPTAIFAASDALAAGAIKAAQSLGIAVPGTLSVIGFGDTAIAAQMPVPLTSVQLPTGEMAFAAAIQLIAKDTAPPQPVEFFGSLIPRASTGPAAA
jgi:LacI family transcriptional regulator